MARYGFESQRLERERTDGLGTGSPHNVSATMRPNVVIVKVYEFGDCPAMLESKVESSYTSRFEGGYRRQRLYSSTSRELCQRSISRSQPAKTPSVALSVRLFADNP